MEPFLQDEAHLDELRVRFEYGTWPARDFTHAAHVAIGAIYLERHSLEETVTLLRERIPRYNVAQGGKNTDEAGYHETLTTFWVCVIAGFLQQLPAGLARLERVRAAVRELGAKGGLFREYYSFDVVKSVEARRHWIPPDLKALTGPAVLPARA